jgi:hypothetical protein
MSLENMSEDERNSLALKRLFTHPEVGMEAKRLYKKVTPDAKFPDLDAEDRQVALRKELSDKVAALEEKVQTDAIMQRRKEHHAEIRAAGFDPDAVEKLMTDERIGSYETAMKYMKAQNANVAPTPGNVTPLQMPADYKDIAKNPKGWATAKAHEAINELIAKRAQG